jgi:CHAT domain-containing protein
MVSGCNWRLFCVMAFFFAVTVMVSAGNIDTGDHAGIDRNSSKALAGLNEDFLASLKTRDTAKSRVLLSSILELSSRSDIDSLTRSDSYFYAGYYHLLKGANMEAARLFNLSCKIRKALNCMDGTYSKCLYNLGVAYFRLGDFKSTEKVVLSHIAIDKKLHGESATGLFGAFSSLVSAYTELHEYTTAISYGDTALSFINDRSELSAHEIASLYSNIGVCYSRLSDFSKTVLYLEKAESIYNAASLSQDENYINLLNSLASAYFFLGQKEKSNEYFNKGMKLTRTSFSYLSLNFLNSYAIILGNDGQKKKGEEILTGSLERAKKFYGVNAREYIDVLKNYAEYLRVFRIDPEKSLRLYGQCNAYINAHSEDIALKDPVLLGYAHALSLNGEQEKALEIIQNLLFSGSGKGMPYPATDNPGIGKIKSGHWTLGVMKAKYGILWDMYKKTSDFAYLEAASGTAEMIVNLIEKMRINISEEDSRIILGDRYRDSYLYAIRDFELCYRKTGNQAYLLKAFEYSEKSKVAGLLASTRELKATQFHIPADIAGFERKLRSDISFYTEKIESENLKRLPDPTLLTDWKDLLLDATHKRDSIVSIFEKKYPEYYLIKYNTRVLTPEKILALTGRNTNYINYVVADTVVYIFLVNRKYTRLTAVHVDSMFFRNISGFRDLLFSPAYSENARSGFIDYQQLGNYVYRSLVEPVRSYLISDRILISPDNILSYLPFEALPVSIIPSDRVLYRNLPYLMNEFRISYTYSATFLAESLRHDYSISNKAVAFAPVYPGTISLDSLMMTRQTNSQGLHDLPFARTEAEYVAEITGGKLYLNNDATETSFKSEAGKYDIIHLAMHTALNDRYPMHSKMIFCPGRDSIEDGYLNTYEVYGIPLKAKMVVLSSCNTGIGQQHSGEGILSLARGFVYSGSQSVLMSLWEVEDRSGAEIVKNFYGELKKGETKSEALRKARIKYLKNSDMLTAHPYYWSALAIYGNDSPLYYSRKFVVRTGAVLLLILLTLFYSYRRLR